jgi:hypothetical protein
MSNSKSNTKSLTTTKYASPARKSPASKSKSSKSKDSGSKRGKSGYNVFMGVMMKKLKEEGEVEGRERLRVVGQMWRELTQKEKEKYNDMAYEENREEGREVSSKSKSKYSSKATDSKKGKSSIREDFEKDDEDNENKDKKSQDERKDNEKKDKKSHDERKDNDRKEKESTKGDASEGEEEIIINDDKKK